MSSDAKIFTILGLIIVVMIGSFLVGWPMYRVWQQGLRGEASLARAEQERQIEVEQARAERDAAVLRAEAIAIVGEAARDYPEYRYQEFLGALGQALRDGSVDQIIYLPTESGVPLMKPIQ